MTNRLIPAVLLVAMLAAITASPAFAFPYGARGLVQDEVSSRLARMDEFSDRPPEAGMGWDLYLNLDDTPVLIAELIRDEHWLQLVRFERDNNTFLPVLSAQMFMVYGEFAHHRVVRQRGGVEQRSRISSSTSKVPDPGIPVLLRLLFPAYVKGEPVGLLQQEHTPRRTKQGYGLLRWLFEEEGVFSGTEWDWENFLPRLLSVVALVVAGLLLIEFLRFLVMLGVRTVGRVDKRQP